MGQPYICTEYGGTIRYIHHGECASAVTKSRGTRKFLQDYDCTLCSYCNHDFRQHFRDNGPSRAPSVTIYWTGCWNRLPPSILRSAVPLLRPDIKGSSPAITALSRYIGMPVRTYFLRKRFARSSTLVFPHFVPGTWFSRFTYPPPFSQHRIAAESLFRLFSRVS